MPISSRLPSIRPTTRRERIKRNEATKSKDEIFLDKDSPIKFEFNSDVARVFDDMLERSVPLYRECQDLTVNWCKSLATPDKCVYDLGCSTGTLLLLLAKSIPITHRVTLIGVDNSAAMISKARKKLNELSNTVNLIEANIDDSFLFNDSCAVVMNYTLQFIPTKNRAPLLKKIYKSLMPGGGFILNEKVLSENELLSNTFAEMHHDFKQGHGYSKMEISKKRDALENVLIPLKLSKTMALVRDAGFTNVDIFFKWNNFAGLIALK
jgi:tRNA (cmo5U34)-methyltransferase